MRFIRLTDNEASMTLINILMGNRVNNKVRLSVMNMIYQIKVGANGEGRIIVNYGMGVDTLTLVSSGNLILVRNTSIDKNIDGVQYYGYESLDNPNIPVMYITQDTAGTYTDAYIYGYNVLNNSMVAQNENPWVIAVAKGESDGPQQRVFRYMNGEEQVFSCNTEIATISVVRNEVNTSLGSYVNYSLTDMEIPEGVTIISNASFAGCEGLENIVIADTVTEIGREAFVGCVSLTSVEIPEGVTKIGDYAFAGCSSLSNITYKGTVSQWNAMNKGANWHDATQVSVVHCSDGDVTL